MPQSGPARPGPPPARARARDLGIDIGGLPTGPGNAITDVPGVLVGHATVWREEPDPPAGRGVARTGVTAVVPGPPVALMAEALPAGVAVLNGAGELTSAIEVRELGWLQTPIVLTSTMQVGRAWDGLIEVLCELDPTLGLDDVVIPMVGECDDSWLNDARRTQISVDDVRAAVLGATPGPVAEGAVGAGTGMICFGWKGGIGTASRQLETGHTVGVLLLTNFGAAEHLTVAGVPVGRTLRPPPSTDEDTDDAGSCIGIVATDAPCAPDDLERVARRIGLGLARGGSVAFSGSGEIFVAFSTVPFGREVVLRHRQLNPLFAAVVEAAEEALLNSLTAADTVTGAHDHTIAGLPLEETQALVRAAGRLRS
jgi:D-aminopeptidase